MAIDTLDYVKKLEAAGISRPQAEAHAEAVKSAVVPDLATRQDLQSVKRELEGTLQSVKQELENSIRSVKQELESKFVLIQWMLGFNLAATMAVLWKLLR